MIILQALAPRGLPIKLAPGLSLMLEPRSFVLLGLAAFFYVIDAFVGNDWCYIIPSGVLAAVTLGILLPLVQVATVLAEGHSLQTHETGETPLIRVTVGRRRPFTWLSNMIPSGFLSANIVLKRRVPEGWSQDKIVLPVPAVIRSLSHAFVATIAVPRLKRGVYDLAEIDIATCFPFGISWCVRSVKIKSGTDAITFYPPLYTMTGRFQTRLSVKSQHLGQRERSWIQTNKSINIKTLREFNERDNLTHIHWASSVRCGKLMVREFEAESHAEFDVALDLSAPWHGEQFELAVSTCYALLQFAERQSLQPSLLLHPSVDTRPLSTLMKDIPHGLLEAQIAAETLARVFPLAVAESREEATRRFPQREGRSLITILPSGKDCISVNQASAPTVTLATISHESEIQGL